MPDSFLDLEALGLFTPPPELVDPPKTVSLSPPLSAPEELEPQLPGFPPAQSAPAPKSSRRTAKPPRYVDPYRATRMRGPHKNFEAAPLWHHQAIAVSEKVDLLVIDALSLVDYGLRIGEFTQQSSVVYSELHSLLAGLLATILSKHSGVPWALVFEPQDPTSTAWRTRVHSLYRRSQPYSRMRAYSLSHQLFEQAQALQWPVYRDSSFEARDLAYSLSQLNLDTHNSTTVIVSDRVEFCLQIRPGCEITTPLAYTHPRYATVAPRLDWRAIEVNLHIRATEQLYDFAVIAPWPSLNPMALSTRAVSTLKNYLSKHGPSVPTLRVLTREVFDQRHSPCPSKTAQLLRPHLRALAVNKALLSHPGDGAYVAVRPLFIPEPPALCLPVARPLPDSVQPISVHWAKVPAAIPVCFRLFSKKIPMSWHAL